MERRAFARLPRGCAADGSNFNACRPDFADCKSVPHLEETRRGRPVSTRTVGLQKCLLLLPLALLIVAFCEGDILAAF